MGHRRGESRPAQIDTRKWLLSKALPKIYGDKLTAELTGKDGQPLQPINDMRELARELAFILNCGMKGPRRAGGFGNKALSCP